jgi:hypothetical protein
MISFHDLAERLGVWVTELMRQVVLEKLADEVRRDLASEVNTRATKSKATTRAYQR